MIKGLHHNAYRCRDSEETRAFYEDDSTVSMVLVIQIFVDVDTRVMDEFDPWTTHYVEIQRRML